MEKKRSLVGLGKGSIDLVVNDDGREAVLQSIAFDDSKGASTILKEVNLLLKLRNPYVLEYWDVWIESGTKKICILMEYCKQGSLSDLVTKVRSQKPLLHFPEKDVLNWLFCIASGLKYVHEMGIIHKALSLQNILLLKNRDAKIGSFGFLTTANFGIGKVDSNRYDLWCLGCILYNLCTLTVQSWGAPEDPNFDLEALRVELAKQEMYSSELRTLVGALLSNNAETPSAQEILLLPWVQDFQSTFKLIAESDCSQLLKLQKYIKIHLAANDYQMNLLVTNGMSDAYLHLMNQLTQLHIVNKTVEQWKSHDFKTNLLEHNSTAYSKSNPLKTNWGLSGMLAQIRKNPAITASVLAATGFFSTGSSSAKDFNNNLLVNCIYRFMCHPTDQIEFLKLCHHLLEQLHKQQRSNTIVSGALNDLFYSYGVAIGSREYFLYVVNDIIMEILASEELVLIADPEKQKAIFGKVVKDSQIAQQNLEYYTSKFVSAILVNLESVPTGIRMLAKDLSIPERRTLIFKCLFWRFLLQPELTCAFSRVSVPTTAKANLNEIIPVLFANFQLSIFDKYWEDLVNVADLTTEYSPVPLTSVFLKEDVKRLMELCGSELWTHSNGKCSDEEFAELPDNKAILVEYSPLQKSTQSPDPPPFVEAHATVRSTKKRLRFVLNTISDIGAVSLSKSPIQVLQDQKAANWNAAYPSSIATGLALLIDAMLGLPQEYQAENFQKLFSEVEQDIKDEQLKNIDFLNERSYAYNKLLASCEKLDTMTSLSYDYLSFLRLKSLATPKSSPLEDLLKHFDLSRFATSMSHKEKRHHCSCKFIEETICSMCKHKKQECSALMKKCLELVKHTKCSEQEMKYMMIRIERTVMDGSYETLRTELEEDFKLRSKLTVAKLDLADFDINPRLLQGAPWHAAQDELHKITKFTAPCDKIKCLSAYTTTLYNLTEVGADDALPVRAFVLYSVLSSSIGVFHKRGQLTDPHSHFKFISLYGNLPSQEASLLVVMQIDLTVVVQLLEAKLMKNHPSFESTRVITQAAGPSRASKRFSMFFSSKDIN